MEILIIIGLISVIVEIIKEKTQPTIPAENWNNWDLIHVKTDMIIILVKKSLKTI